MILLSASFRSLMQLIGVLIIFVFVLIITDFTTKWVGGFQKIQMSKGNLMVLETIRIANGKFLQLVKAGEQYFVIAVGKDEVTKIAELTEDQLSVQTSDDMKNSQENFQEIFSRLKDHFPKKQDSWNYDKIKKDILYTVINICNSSVCGSVVCLTKQNDCLCSFHGSGQH